MSENTLLCFSFAFAAAIGSIVDGVTVSESACMTERLSRTGTSAGVNIYKAQYAHSKRGFLAKREIAFKAFDKTSGRLERMPETDSCYRSASLAKQACPDMAILGISVALW